MLHCFMTKHHSRDASPPACCSVVGAPSPAMDKVDVNGDGAEPLYAWMKEAKKEGGIAAAMGNDIKWRGRSSMPLTHSTSCTHST